MWLSFSSPALQVFSLPGLLCEQGYTNTATIKMLPGFSFLPAVILFVSVQFLVMASEASHFCWVEKTVNQPVTLSREPRNKFNRFPPAFIVGPNQTRQFKMIENDMYRYLLFFSLPNSWHTAVFIPTVSFSLHFTMKGGIKWSETNILALGGPFEISLLPWIPALIKQSTHKD